MDLIKKVQKLYINKSKEGNILKNITYLFVFKIISILTGLLIVPMSIKFIDSKQYGLWLTIGSIASWFSFFDIGFGNGLRNKFTFYKATGNLKELRLIVSTTYISVTVLFGFLGSIFLIANKYLDWAVLLNQPESQRQYLSQFTLIVFECFFLQFILKLISTILVADHKSAMASFIDTLSQMLVLGLIILFNFIDFRSLFVLGIISSVCPVVILIIANLWLFRGEYVNFSPSFKYFRLTYVRELLSIGLKFFVIQIAVVVIYQTTNIILTHIGQPEDVTLYNIVYKYFGMANMVFTIVINPYWAAFTEAFALNDYTWMKNTIFQLRKIAIGIILLIVLMIALSNSIFHIWIGKLIHIPMKVSLIMAFYFCTLIWCGLHSMVLNGLGKVKLQLYISILSSIVNIPLALFLGNRFGIIGVIGSSIILNLISMVYSPIQVNKIITKTANGIWNE